MAYTEDCTKFFSHKNTPGVGYTGESGLTGESLVQPSRPANALKGKIPEKVECES
jgi:hypothetical protein